MNLPWAAIAGGGLIGTSAVVLLATLGMLGFWFLEVASLLFVYMLANYLLSGHMFPLDRLDGIATGILGISLGDVVKMLPFEYTAYFPAAIWLGKISGPAMYQGQGCFKNSNILRYGFFACYKGAISKLEVRLLWLHKEKLF